MSAIFLNFHEFFVSQASCLFPFDRLMVMETGNKNERK